MGPMAPVSQDQVAVKSYEHFLLNAVRRALVGLAKALAKFLLTSVRGRGPDSNSVRRLV